MDASEFNGPPYVLEDFMIRRLNPAKFSFFTEPPMSLRECGLSSPHRLADKKVCAPSSGIKLLTLPLRL